MASVKHAISEHDTVVLSEPVGAWATGTCGAAISVHTDDVLVEIVGPAGETLDMISVPAERLHIINA
jgi:hypothetical protein